MFNFLFNPNSFTQTVENIFDYSFLMKHQRAEITILDGMPYVFPRKEPDDNDWAAGLQLISMVVKMDYRMFLELLKTFQITESWLPERPAE